MKNIFVSLCMTIGFFVIAGCGTPPPPPATIDYKSVKDAAVQETRSDTGLSLPAEDKPRERLETEFRLYDLEAQEKINDSIRQLIKKHPYLTDQGVVILSFRLYANGMISDLKCLAGKDHRRLVKFYMEAINHAAPFRPWPSGAERFIKNDYRLITYRSDNRSHRAPSQ